MVKKSQEDYLRIMYELREEQGNRRLGIKKSQVARVLDISRSGVTQMMDKIMLEGLIEMDLYSRIFFTKKGLALAEKITRKHRIIEVFLRDILGYKSLLKISEEAHKLEHCFSDQAIKRLDDYLGHPKECPHGDLIYD